MKNFRRSQNVWRRTLYPISVSSVQSGGSSPTKMTIQFRNSIRYTKMKNPDEKSNNKWALKYSQSPLSTTLPVRLRFSDQQVSSLAKSRIFSSMFTRISWPLRNLFSQSYQLRPYQIKLQHNYNRFWKRRKRNQAKIHRKITNLQRTRP